MRWRDLLDRHGIPYSVDRSERNVTLQCPFCGAADAKKHDLAVSIKGKGWKCWRNMKHRGRSNTRLVQALLKCSWDHARTLSGESDRPALVEDKSLLAQVQSHLGRPVAASRATKLPWPPEFKPLQPTGYGVPFWRYLRDRGYADQDILWLTEHYGLRYAVKGPFRYRLIVPILSPGGKLVNWTARAIDPRVDLRYKTLPTEGRDGFAALMPPKAVLLGLPLLWNCINPRVLVVCEGPFDALRISTVGHAEGVYGTCLFGLNASAEQAELLEELATRFKHIRLVLDEDAALRAFSLLQSFSAIPIRTAALPYGVKDPGAMRPSQAKAFIEELHT